MIIQWCNLLESGFGLYAMLKQEKKSMISWNIVIVLWTLF